MQIIHLRHNEIDYEQWDKAILASRNQLIYAHSWFLDTVSPGWEALVSDHYEYVMPLPIKRKFGISYLTQPPYTQQLGIFSKENIDQEVSKQFISKIPYFSYEINFNEANKVENAFEKPNYILNLSSQYEDLAKKFSKNTQRNLNKTLSQELEFSDQLSDKEFWDFYGTVTHKYGSWHPSTIKDIIANGIEKNMISFYAVSNSDKKIIAAVSLLHSENRITYLLPVSNEEGKNHLAMFFLIDQLIKKFANQNILLDFEGSKVEGIARFYKGFGATLQPYFTIKKNKPKYLVDKLRFKK